MNPATVTAGQKGKKVLAKIRKALQMKLHKDQFLKQPSEFHKWKKEYKALKAERTLEERHKEGALQIHVTGNR